MNTTMKREDETPEQLRNRMKYAQGPHKISYRAEHDMWAIEFPDWAGVKEWASNEIRARAMCASFDLNPFDFQLAHDEAAKAEKQAKEQEA